MKITTLFEPIEKLINEHGSAAILRDHVALFRDQLAILKDQFTVLTKAKKKTDSENEKLKTENQYLKKENDQLNKQISVYKNGNKKVFHKDLLNDIQALILQCLSSVDHDTFCSLEEIRSTLKISEQIIIYHLKELEDKSMAEHKYVNGVHWWTLDHAGRGYLIKHKLMSCLR